MGIMGVIRLCGHPRPVGHERVPLGGAGLADMLFQGHDAVWPCACCVHLGLAQEKESLDSVFFIIRLQMWPRGVDLAKPVTMLVGLPGFESPPSGVWGWCWQIVQSFHPEGEAVWF